MQVAKAAHRPQEVSPPLIHASVAPVPRYAYNKPLLLTLRDDAGGQSRTNNISMQKKTIETIIRIAIAILSAILGGLAQTSCHVLPHDALTQILGSFTH